MSHPATTHPHYPVGHPFIELKSVDSTNNYAMAQVHAGLALPGTVYFAHEQFAGKGQRGKAWASPPGENIIMSIVLRPDFLEIGDQFALSTTIALACHDFLNTFSDPDFRIKWPNDLYWRDRKTGGILIENVLHGSRWEYAIAGIGINVNQLIFPEHLTNATSIQQVTGNQYQVVELAKSLCVFIDTRYRELMQKEFGQLNLEYNRVLYKSQEKVRLKKEDVVFETVIKKVLPDGRLLTFDKEERFFNFGEVEWIMDEK